MVVKFNCTMTICTFDEVGMTNRFSMRHANKWRKYVNALDDDTKMNAIQIITLKWWNTFGNFDTVCKSTFKYVPCHHRHQLSMCCFISRFFRCSVDNSNLLEHWRLGHRMQVNNIIASFFCFSFAVHQALVCAFQFQWVTLALTGRLLFSSVLSLSPSLFLSFSIKNIGPKKQMNA